MVNIITSESDLDDKVTQDFIIKQIKSLAHSVCPTWDTDKVRVKIGVEKAFWWE